MRLFGLIGYPLSHSFSKSFFTEKFEKEGLTGCRYELFPLTSIEEFPALLAANPELAGLNVTIPYKKQVLQYLTSVASIPKGLDACNCIKITGGRLEGFNTDIFGFEQSLAPLLKAHHTKALVLGHGGAAEAVIFVLKKLGIPFETVRRSHHSSVLTYNDLDEKIIRAHTIVINTTPVGTYPKQDECPAIPYQYLSGEHLLFDLVYNPAKTLFLQKGEEKGTTIKNGEEMLILQAEESWRIWNVKSESW